MSRLTDFFADYVPGFFIDYAWQDKDGEEHGQDGNIGDLGLRIPSDTLFGIYNKICQSNPEYEFNYAVGLAIKQALQDKLGIVMTRIYISDEDTGEIYIDE